MPAGATNFPASESGADVLMISTAALRWAFVAVILLSSLTTLAQASGLTGGHGNGDAVILASIEIAAILAFVSEYWRPWATVALVMIFAIAFILSAIEGEFAARFIYFAISAIYLQGVADGPATGQTLA